MHVLLPGNANPNVEYTEYTEWVKRIECMRGERWTSGADTLDYIDHQSYIRYTPCVHPWPPCFLHMSGSWFNPLTPKHSHIYFTNVKSSSTWPSPRPATCLPSRSVAQSGGTISAAFVRARSLFSAAFELRSSTCVKSPRL